MRKTDEVPDSAAGRVANAVDCVAKERDRAIIEFALDPMERSLRVAGRRAEYLIRFSQAMHLSPKRQKISSRLTFSISSN